MSDHQAGLVDDIIKSIEWLKSWLRGAIWCGISKDVAYTEIWEDVGRHAAASSWATVVNGRGLVVSWESCLFVCYHVCIIESLCKVRSARLHGATVVSSMALLPLSYTVLRLLAPKIVLRFGAYICPDGTDNWEAWCTVASETICLAFSLKWWQYWGQCESTCRNCTDNA